MKLEQIADLPLVVGTDVAADMLGIDVDTLRRLVREHRSPVEPITCGRVLRWPTARLLDALGLQRDNAEPSQLGVVIDLPATDERTRHGHRNPNPPA